MANAVVSESALRDLLSEALENDGAMGYDAEPPIVPNAATDRTTLQLDTDPVELRHVPRSKNELIIMVRNLLDDVPDDQSGELYKKIRDIFKGDDTGTRDFAGAHAMKTKVTPDINQARDLQRDPNKMESKQLGEFFGFGKKKAAPVVKPFFVQIHSPELQGRLQGKESSAQGMGANILTPLVARAGFSSPKFVGVSDDMTFKFQVDEPDSPQSLNDALKALPHELSSDGGPRDWKIMSSQMSSKTENKGLNMANHKLVDVIKDIIRETMTPGAPAAAGAAPGGATAEMDEADPKDPKKTAISGAGRWYDPEDPEDRPGPVGDPLFVKDDGLEDGPFGDDELSDSTWDPDVPGDDDDDDDDDDDNAGEKKRKSRAGLEIGAYGVDGMTLEKIGEELGFTKEAAKKAIETAMERFKVLHMMEPEDRDELVLVGVSDYIDMLGKTGEMTEEEEEFMRLHPKVVAMSDNFRDFFSKYVKRAAREMRADTQDDTDL